MRIVNFYIVLLLSCSVYGQETKISQNEIDTTVWKPFKTAFETLDATALNRLYANQVLRVTPSSIDTKGTFKTKNEKRFNEHRKSNTKINLDFWFDSRHTNAHTSYEVGFYRMQLLNSKQTHTIYGQFHIVLQKIEGQWKITQDWDTDRIGGKPINAEEFEKSQPLEFK